MGLKITTNELEIILNACKDGIYVSDNNLVGIYANQAFERISGIPVEAWVGNSLLKMKEEGLISGIVSKRVLEQMQPVTMMQTFNSGNVAIVTGMPTFKEDGSIDKIVSTAHNITEITRLSEQLKQTNLLMDQYQQELNYLRKKTQSNADFIAKNPKMEQIVQLVSRVSEIDVPVLLLGESGVGKEVVANLIHKSSPRKNHPFIEVNCGAIPKELIESELFGYVSGAFTGAKKEGKPGLFELANTGTIFLDEIGDLPLNLQVKLLRVLQSLKVNRLGDSKTIQLDVRIIAATNKNLKEMVAKNEFREDLYYRLNVVPVQIPPLRERKEDIPILAAFFLDQFNHKYNKKKHFQADFLNALESYHWPGNVRELKNLMERIVVLSESEVIDFSDLPYQYQHDISLASSAPSIPQPNPAPYTYPNPKLNTSHMESNTTNLKEMIEALEKQVILASLTREKTVSRAAELLGVSQPTLSRKIQKYKIQQLLQYTME